jgi:hypothetical protein
MPWARAGSCRDNVLWEAAQVSISNSTCRVAFQIGSSWNIGWRILWDERGGAGKS